MHQDASSVQVVILCGGMGTRLREETEFRPKPLIEIGGKPILWHIMKTYAHYGYKEFVLCLGYKGHMIKDYFVNYRLMNNDFTLRLNGSPVPSFHSACQKDEDWVITFVDTGTDAMTGARVKRIEPYIKGDHFMLTYGDGVGNVALDRLWDFHLRQGKVGTVTGVRPFSRYGELSIEGNFVREFNEKPPIQDGLVSGGFFAFRRQFFDYLKDEDACVLEREPLASLARECQLACYAHRDFWHAMDTYRDFMILNDLWKKSPHWKVWQ